MTANEPAEKGRYTFANVTEAIPDVLYILDTEGLLKKWNRRLETVTGLSAHEIRGRSALDFFAEADRSMVAEAIRAAFATGYAKVEAQMLQDGGSTAPYEFTGVPLKDRAGAVIGLTGVGRDISERKRAEAELERLAAHVEQQASTLEGILSASPDHVYVFDRDGRFTYVSLAGARAHGLRQADIVGKNSRDLGIPAEIASAAATQRDRVFATGSPISNQIRLPTIDGLRDFDYTLSPILQADGAVEAVVATARDITEHKRAEQRTAVLLEVAQDIGGTLDLGEVFARVLPRTAEALPCDGVVVFHLDSLRNVTRMIAHHGLSPELCALVEGLEFPPDQPFGGRLGRGETLVIDDMRAQSWLSADFFTSFDIQALVAAPLRVRGRGLGALVGFKTRRGGRFRPDQVDLLRGIAGQLAVAMESTALYRAQQQEAEVSAVLARLGREMIALLDTPVLLSRLCELTTEVLHCDYSHIWLWQPEEDAYVAASSHGDPAEHWEALRAIKLPRTLIAPLLERLEHGGIANVNMANFGNVPLARLPSRYGITVSLMLALQRGGEIVGLHTAGYRGRQERFTPEQERVARGIAQLGSLALGNARLVEQLERANRLKSDFVATMSHELRTPLNIIMGYTELLLGGAFGPVSAEQSEALQRTDKSARTLLELITATLNMSRLEAGRLTLDVSAVDPAEIIREVDAEVRELHDEKPNVRFAWKIDGALPEMLTDSLKLKVVLKNLIGNAIKFTEAGSVVVHVRPDRDGIAFSVRDTGIGIETEQQQVIFEAFRQVDSSATRRHGGVGLGLYIVRRLVEMMGGTLALESEPGRGSTFHVWLPERCGSPTDAQEELARSL